MAPRTLLTLTVAGALAGLASLGPATPAGGSSTLTVDVQDASATDSFTNNEITLAVDPTNHDNLVIGDNDYAFNDGCGVNYSHDGGQSWGVHSFIPHITKYDDSGATTDGQFDFAGDPAVTFGPDGTAYFACYGYAIHGTYNTVVLFVSKSHDAGETWGRPHAVTSCDCAGVGKGASLGGNGQFPDHEAITADTWPGSPYYGRIYVTQAQFHGNGGPSPITLFWSDDGVHWSKPVQVSHSPLKRNQDAVPAVGPDGHVYVTFDNQHAQDNGTSNSYVQRVFIARSTNGGRSFGADHRVITWVNPVDSDLANSEYRAASYPVPAVDSDNRITVVWNDRRTGASQVFAQRARAADIGAGPSAWTAPLQLNPSSHQQFFPWVSVAPDGRADVIFYDRTLDPHDFLNYVTYVSLTPTTGLAVTRHVTAITRPANSNGFDGSLETGQVTTGCSAFIGDYIGIASTNRNVFLGWTDNGAPNTTDPQGNDVGCDVNQDDFSAHVSL